MSTFFGASVGRKFIVAISGLFLIVFLMVHLIVNLTLLAGQETYNAVAYWMGANPAIKVMQPVLALGLLVHVGYSLVVSYQSWRARPNRYFMVDPAGGSTWASRNMLVLGGLIVLFLALHLSSFSIRMKLGAPPVIMNGAGVQMVDVYSMVTARFEIWWYVAAYLMAMLFLGFHLAHGLQSGLATLGLTDHRWRGMWTGVGLAYAVVVAAGFAILPAYFFIQAQLS